MLCPRCCGVNRRQGQRGFCRAGAVPEIFRYAPHFGEEPPVSGTRGSGTVFFSRCTLGCIYCQNFPWSQEGRGETYSTGRLAGMLQDLAAAGCHNWNLVSPTPWLPAIAEAVAQVKAAGVSLPIVYNTSGYERVETLRQLEGWVQVYLTDLRYAEPASAQEGSGAADYVDAAREALGEMWRQTGPLKLDAAGVARQGTICRLLILPGRAQEAVDNLRWLAENVGTQIPVSVMAQYLPLHRAGTAGAPWNRRISRQEYGQVGAALEEFGFTEGWMQELEDRTSQELIGCEMPEGGVKP